MKNIIIYVIGLIILFFIFFNLKKVENFDGDFNFEPYTSRLNFNITEGSLLGDEAKFLHDFITKHNCKDVMEIGFNGGLSSYVILSTKPDVNLISFDIGEHPYVLNAKKLIDEFFPRRHTLIIGDSVNTLPMYNSSKFDMIFVDGDHKEEAVEKDITNSLTLLKPGGFIIADDYYQKENVGVDKAVNNLIQSKVVKVYDGPHKGAADRGWIVLKPFDEN